MKTTVEAAAPPAGLILGAGEVRLWGMSAAERLRRIFRRVGVAVGDSSLGEGAPTDGTVVLALGDWVYDESLIAAVARRPNSVLLAEDGEAVAAHVPAGRAAEAAAALTRGADPGGLEQLRLGELAYNEALRKREPPVLVRLSRENVRQVEARTFQGSYKGVTDIVTKYLWPVPARIVTRWCAVAKLRPNHVTFVGLLLTLATFWLFWTGDFTWGLACAWGMTFLDTVDGKLARVTLTSSKIGNIFDHGIDLVSPPFWWFAWWVGCQQLGLRPPHPRLAAEVMIAGYVFQRVIEGIFMRRFGFHIHSWRPFDSWFRLITARRNPNLLILTPAWIIGRPQDGFYLVAIWTAISLGVHTLQFLQALITPKARVVSWLSR